MINDGLLHCCVLLILTAVGIESGINEWPGNPKESRCLTGYMTDIQHWVNEFGEFTDNVDSKTAIDLSTKQGMSQHLGVELSRFKSSKEHQVKYLSMAKCKLTRVPMVFKLQDNLGLRLADTLQFLTLYGNHFGVLDAENEIYEVSLNATDASELPVPVSNQKKSLATWSFSFRMVLFHRLKELDLRACSIQVIGDLTFETMPDLRRLYLGENNIFYIDSRAFAGLKNLRHLDLSRNYAYDESSNLENIVFESANVFNDLTLESVDFSFTRLGKRNVPLLGSFGRRLKSMSVCNSGLGRLPDDTFSGTPLKYLDVSGNTEVLYSSKVLRHLVNHLEVLYADNVSLKNIEGFVNFPRLEILKLSNNEINAVPQNVARSLTNLQVLDLDNNRMTSWFNMTFSVMPNLKLLSLKNNNINVISREMYFDVEKLSYLGLSGNFLVCNCHARDIFEVASNNEMLFSNTYIETIRTDIKDFVFHTGFMDFNNIIRRRRNITTFCERRKGCTIEFNYDVNGNYLLLDYDDFTNQYQCLLVSEGKTTGLYSLTSCASNQREFDIEEDEKIISSWNRYLLFLIPVMTVPFLLCIYFFRKNFKYFLITIKNSATLSLISNKNDSTDEDAIFNYDVFVSYCNEDRAWVLDNLLSHVEKDCNISVCLHERDFQVGLSILENIVSCMDRSRMIMLIISKRFLLSQWCQFEMHLAQHRLLETRREDLIIVLLEEIPRSLRPNTLHYLMLTKTYIVWPNEEAGRNLFWRRMKKCLVTHKLKQTENVSLA